MKAKSKSKSKAKPKKKQPAKVKTKSLDRLYELEDDGAFDTLFPGDNSFQLKAQKKQNKTVFIYDSFDFRIFKSGHLILGSEDQFELRQIGEIDSQMVLTLPDGGPVPGDEIIRPYTFRDVVVADHLEMRALMRTGRFRRVTSPYAVLDNTGHTIAYISHYRFDVWVSGRYRPGRSFIRLQSISGFEKWADVLKKVLKQKKLKRFRGDPILYVFRTAGILIPAYDNKPDVLLNPKEPAYTALSRLILGQLAVIRANLSGLKSDHDIEFTHDFRVAVRRIRTIIGQLRSVYSAEITDKVGEDFRSMQKATNLLRDLDVYLGYRDKYTKLAGEEHGAALAVFFKDLKEERTRSLLGATEYISSNEFRSKLSYWTNFFTKQLSQTAEARLLGETGAGPVGILAQGRLQKQFRRIIKKGSSVKQATPDTVLHNLRIDCKRLRYSLEFFASLMPAADLKKSVKMLKGLQDNLGELNDLHVQMLFIDQYIQRYHASAGGENESTAVALEVLVGKLKEENTKVRSEFAGRFEKFAAKSNMNRFKRLVAAIGG